MFWLRVVIVSSCAGDERSKVRFLIGGEEMGSLKIHG